MTILFSIPKLLLFFVTLAFIVAMHSVSAHAAGKPVVYFIPHQDDETISMGADIAAHTDAKRAVYLVLVTDGGASAARTSICQKTTKCLSVPEFVAARNKEFIAAAYRLGVPSTHISFKAVPDGTLTPAIAGKIIDEFIGKYPDASFKTMSWLDRLPDHYHLGYELNSRCIKGVITDCRFLQSPLYQTGSSIRTYPVVTPRSGIYNSKAKVQAAASQYRYWNPAVGRYSVGHYSVKTQIDFAYTNHYSMYHLSSSGWRSESDRLSALKWRQNHQQSDL